MSQDESILLSAHKNVWADGMVKRTQCSEKERKRKVIYLS